jgi:hypothetical protein
MPFLLKLPRNSLTNIMFMNVVKNVDVKTTKVSCDNYRSEGDSLVGFASCRLV